MGRSFCRKDALVVRLLRRDVVGTRVEDEPLVLVVDREDGVLERLEAEDAVAVHPVGGTVVARLLDDEHVLVHRYGHASDGERLGLDGRDFEGPDKILEGGLTGGLADIDRLIDDGGAAVSGVEHERHLAPVDRRVDDDRGLGPTEGHLDGARLGRGEQGEEGGEEGHRFGLPYAFAMPDGFTSEEEIQRERDKVEAGERADG